MLQRTNDKQWTGRHREQYSRIMAGRRNWWPTPEVSERFAREFELALNQRGEDAKEKALKHARSS